jgi:hypothetical protein
MGDPSHVPADRAFRTTAPFAFFDYLRIPYTVDPSAGAAELRGAELAIALRPEGDPWPGLLWPSPGASLGAPGPFRWGEMRLFGSLIPDLAAVVPRLPGRWEVADDLLDPAGSVIANIWREDGGSILIPFDPGDVMRSFWMETYREHGGGGGRAFRRFALRTYYLLRPLIPRRIQIAMRRRFARAQELPDFPRWPAEPSLHDLYRRLYDLAREVAGTEVPWIGFWPAPASWAVVLTHDIETAAGRDAAPPIVDLEAQFGFRSAWNVVPRRYEVRDEFISSLTDRHCEVGLHGLFHDGRDLASRGHLLERLPEMRAVASRIGATGFRSPATQRAPELIGLLGFDHDSSYPDSDPYEPQPGGCATWLPYMIQDTVELPITLPQDHTLFVILQHVDERVWIDKVDALRRRGGMALFLTHPDYLLDPAIRAAYARLIAHLADDAGAWRTLPSEVSAWWRARGGSTLIRSDGEWRISGPAANEGRLRLDPPD